MPPANDQERAAREGLALAVMLRAIREALDLVGGPALAGAEALRVLRGLGARRLDGEDLASSLARGLVQCLSPRPDGPPARGARPCWARAARELRLGGALVKRLPRHAIAQFVVLDRFEGDGWPQEVPNPLGGRWREAARRLRGTVRFLNGCHERPLLVFEVRGGGERVGWRRTEA